MLHLLKKTYPVEISNKELANFVEFVLKNEPMYNMVPSSKSGKYHPKDEYTIGGNDLHLQRVVRVLQHLIKDHDAGEHNKQPKLTQEEKDILYAAAILHDVNKATWSNASGASPNIIYQYLHIYYGGKGWTKRATHFDYKLLIELVAIHGGAWYEPAQVNRKKYVYDNNNHLHRLIHLADFIASRNDIRVNPHVPEDQKNSVSKVRVWLMRKYMELNLGRENKDG